MHNLFLTAPSGTGKSTVIKKVLYELNISIGGFQVERCLDNEGNIYFDMISFKDKKRNNIIGKCAKSKKPIPNLYTFETKGVEILNTSLENSDLIVLDEVGFLEENAENFKSSIIKVLDSNKIVLGVLKEFDSPFLNELRNRKDISIVKVTLDNRNYIASHILDILKNWNVSIKNSRDEMSL
ncbi:nucleoside-triphosphatase [Clostridium sp. Marseille-Q7071]